MQDILGGIPMTIEELKKLINTGEKIDVEL